MLEYSNRVLIFLARIYHMKVNQVINAFVTSLTSKILMDLVKKEISSLDLSTEENKHKMAVLGTFLSLAEDIKKVPLDEIPRFPAKTQRKKAKKKVSDKIAKQQEVINEDKALLERLMELDDIELLEIIE